LLLTPGNGELQLEVSVDNGAGGFRISSRDGEIIGGLCAEPDGAQLFVTEPSDGKDKAEDSSKQQVQNTSSELK